jgi:hypothetical protein
MRMLKLLDTLIWKKTFKVGKTFFESFLQLKFFLPLSGFSSTTRSYQYFNFITLLQIPFFTIKVLGDENLRSFHFLILKSVALSFENKLTE